uniref:Uncharacterized protein n=1 Tax=Catharus ustulatus TaxID=91951 RepID=A0A8C3V5Y6_CATUS
LLLKSLFFYVFKRCVVLAMPVTAIIRSIIQTHDTKPNKNTNSLGVMLKSNASDLIYLLLWVFNIECPFTWRSVSLGSQTFVLVISRYKMKVNQLFLCTSILFGMLEFQDYSKPVNR